MKRRTFVKSALGAAAAAPFMLNGLSVRATTPLKFLAQLPEALVNDRILIICQLFGGNDGLNTVVPAEDDVYYNLRPNIAVPKKLCWNFPGSSLYLNPALTWGDKPGVFGGVAKMFVEGNLAIVQGIGYDNPNLSHFRSTDIWLSSITGADTQTRLESGWVGRYLESKYPNFPDSLPDEPLAIQLSGSTLALQGTKHRMGIEVVNPAGQAGVGTMSDTLDTDSKGTSYETEYAFLADIATRSNKYALAVKNAYNAGITQLKANYNTKDNFAKQMQAVGAMIAGGLKTNVYVVSMGGFDTHVSQTIPSDKFVSGGHPSLLGSFSDAVAQFMNDMIRLNQGDRVLGLTVSEFGRRPQENGSFGTDHGAAGVQFVFGTQVNGVVYGYNYDLAKDLNENGDLRFSVDFRSVYAEVLTDWFGMPLNDAQDLLHAGRNLPVTDVIKPQSVGVSNRDYTEHFAITSNYPNPFASKTTLELSLPDASHVTLEISSLTGGETIRVFDRNLAAGRQSIPLDLNLPSGSYLCVAKAGGRMTSKMIQCMR